MRGLDRDHIDLLVTAADRWGVLEHLVLSPQAAGQSLQDASNLAVAHLTQLGRLRVSEREVLSAPYRHAPVDELVPVVVLKATHSAASFCSSSSTWSRSTAAAALLAGVERAAEFRLPGYGSAPWRWRRATPGSPVGVGGAWRPAVPGVRWVDVCDARDHWSPSPLVVVTVEVSDALPADLPARSSLVVLAPQPCTPDEAWQALDALALPAVLLRWPGDAATLVALAAETTSAHGAEPSRRIARRAS